MSPSEVSDVEVRELLDIIHRKYGYDLRGYAPASIKRRVQACLSKSRLRDVGELRDKLLADPEFFFAMMEELTVRVSEMFRDPDFYRAFRARVVPILRTYPLCKIWHSGCATGEEAYTTAIILHEEGLFERTQLYATDLSGQAIALAREGTYSAKQIEAFTRNYESSGGERDITTYYTQAYDRIAIKDFLRRNIVFFQHNLVSDHGFGEMQVIFCRNVLIYFERTLQSQVLEKFSRSLCPGGFLCLGASEHLPPAEKAYAVFAPAERIYQHVG